MGKLIEQYGFDNIIEKLRDDEHYYGEFGKQFMSNSMIYKILNDPLALFKEDETTVPLVMGQYFHNLFLEPEKIPTFPVIEASTRSTNIYKNQANGEVVLLQNEVDLLKSLETKIRECSACMSLIEGDNVVYEEPGLIDMHGAEWKMKADILNHDKGLIVDLKTTSDINNFRRSANSYNYDSQAYIYSTFFGYDFVFIAVCKKSGKIGIYDCSPEFLLRGRDKVEKAVELYQVYSAEDFDPKQYFIHETL